MDFSAWLYYRLQSNCWIFCLMIAKQILNLNCKSNNLFLSSAVPIDSYSRCPILSHSTLALENYTKPTQWNYKVSFISSRPLPVSDFLGLCYTDTSHTTNGRASIAHRPPPEGAVRGTRVTLTHPDPWAWGCQRTPTGFRIPRVPLRGTLPLPRVRQGRPGGATHPRGRRRSPWAARPPPSPAAARGRHTTPPGEPEPPGSDTRGAAGQRHPGCPRGSGPRTVCACVSPHTHPPRRRGEKLPQTPGPGVMLRRSRCHPRAARPRRPLRLGPRPAPPTCSRSVAGCHMVPRRREALPSGAARGSLRARASPRPAPPTRGGHARTRPAVLVLSHGIPRARQTSSGHGIHPPGSASILRTRHPSHLGTASIPRTRHPSHLCTASSFPGMAFIPAGHSIHPPRARQTSHLDTCGDRDSASSQVLPQPGVSRLRKALSGSGAVSPLALAVPCLGGCGPPFQRSLPQGTLVSPQLKLFPPVLQVIQAAGKHVGRGMAL